MSSQFLTKCFCHAKAKHFKLESNWKKKRKAWMWGAAVSLTVASEDLQFKGVTCTLSSRINGSAVCLCVSTDVKSNFYTSRVRSLLRLVRKRRHPILHASLFMKLLWGGECEWFMFRSTDKRLLLNVLNVDWRQHASHLAGWEAAFHMKSKCNMHCVTGER